MIVKQLSVFLENKKGRLYSAVETLSKCGINISALSIADTSDYGVLRLLVDEPNRAEEELKAAGVFVKLTDVNAFVMEDSVGGAKSILKALCEADISVEYMYACTGRVSGKAFTLVRTDNTEKTEEVLHAKGFSDAIIEDVYRIN